MEPVVVREDVSKGFYGYATQTSVSRNMVRKSDGSLWCSYMVHNEITDKDEIHCSYSTDDGATWTSEIVIGGAGNDYVYPALAVDSADNLHLVYVHSAADPYIAILEYKKRTGAGWSAAEVLETNNNLSWGSSIAVDSSDNIHVAWCLYGEPYGLKHREKIGDTWQDTETPVAPASLYPPAIAIDGSDDIHLVFVAMGAEGVCVAIYYIKKTAGVWGVAQELTPSHNQAGPSMAIDSSGNVHVAWWGTPDGIYYTMWDAALEVWWPPQYLGGAKYPSVVIDDDDLVQIFCCAGNSLGRLWKTGLPPIGWDWEEIICVSPNYCPSAIWAMWPLVGGVRTNVLDGFSVIWTSGSSYSILYWAFPGPAPAPVIPYDYSMVQQEILDLLSVA